MYNIMCLILIIFPKFYLVGDRTSDVFTDRRIVFFSRVYVLVSEHVGNNINIVRLTVELRAVCTAKLVGRDFFQRGHDFTVFLDEIFDRSDTDTAAL